MTKTLVPIAADGTYPTTANCQSGYGFRAGPKGHEQKFSTLADLIAGLKLMDSAKWRRRNPNGHLGIVTATTWGYRAVA